MSKSAFFKRVFGVERKSQVVIEKMEAEIVQAVVDFAYGNIAVVNLEAQAYELFDAAHKFR